jgi:hypothetical protein
MTETTCEPTTVVVGDGLCLELECDHERTGESGPDGAEEAYCDQVSEETVCGTHSRFETAEDWFEELTHAEPWPCKHTKAVAAS